jgi:hypothetical protein
MAALLLWSSGASLLLLLNAGRIAFLGESSAESPAGYMAADVRFIDVATTWVAAGPGGTAAWAALAALTGFVVIAALRRHQDAALSGRFWLAGLTLTGLLTALESSGTVTVLMGYKQLLEDPTSARDLTASLQVHGPSIVTSLVVTVLSACLTWALWMTHAPAQPPTENSPVTTYSRPIDTTDPEGSYRRPR